MTSATPALRLMPLELDDERARRIHGDDVINAAGMAERLFTLQAAALSGLSFTGGQALPPWPDPALPGGRLSFGGTGVDPAASFAACIGEGVELLSQFERDGDLVAGPGVPAPIVALLAELGADGAEHVAGFDAMTGVGVSLPAALCLRRNPAHRPWRPPWPLSCGCAAGPSRDAAAMRAILELVERDAVALWWNGGASGRPLPPAAAAAMTSLLDRLRGGITGRYGWALDITTNLGIPAVVALSADNDGRGLACGFAARPDATAAAIAATLEMVQVELGLLVARTKHRQGGDAALAAPDRRHIERAALDVADLPLLQPVGKAGPARLAPDVLPGLVRHLAALGIGLWLADLSRPGLRLPVMRALAPGLQPFPSSWIGPRLAACLQCHGGGPGTMGVELL